MNFVREIVEPGRLNGIIDIPEELKHSRLEVIILPAEDSKPATTVKQGAGRFKSLYEKPVKVKNIKTFSRDELHER